MSSGQYVIKYWSLQPSSQSLTHFLKSLKNAKRFEEEKGFYGIILSNYLIFLSFIYDRNVRTKKCITFSELWNGWLRRKLLILLPNDSTFGALSDGIYRIFSVPDPKNTFCVINQFYKNILLQMSQFCEIKLRSRHGQSWSSKKVPIFSKRLFYIIFNPLLIRYIIMINLNRLFVIKSSS